MRIQFSEFSYAYAITRSVEELGRARGQVLIAAPSIPTLRAEGKVGYDVKITTQATTIVLQFKLGEYVSRSRAGSKTWPTAQRAHYRTHFEANHHQLPLMQALETNLTNGGLASIVRYVAPMFHSERDFNKYYVDNSLLGHSYHCRPNEVVPDGGEHFLLGLPAVGGVGRSTFVLSEPRKLKNEDLKLAIQKVLDQPSSEEPGDKDISQGSAVQVVTDILNSGAADAEIDTDKFRDFASRGFEDRPVLANLVYAVELGQSLGIQLSFTASRSTKGGDD